jgi:hypothetical protein
MALAPERAGDRGIGALDALADKLKPLDLGDALDSRSLVAINIPESVNRASPSG